MTSMLLDAVETLVSHRIAIAIGVPLMGGGLVVATSVLMPRGRARGLLTGAYLLLPCVGVAMVLLALAAMVAGEPMRVAGPLMVPGIALGVVIGIFAPETIRAYQEFEFRKLAAEIFRRS
jgi:hypothetical protein